MFENYLFSKYSKYIVGFAYEIGYGGWSGYIVQTLVTEKNVKNKKKSLFRVVK